MSNFDPVDIWRVRDPTLRQFTWRRKTPLQMSRLDFFFMSNDLPGVPIKTQHFLQNLKQ